MLPSMGSARGGDGDEVQSASRSHSVNFAREVRPILSDNCFACHGPDDQKRKAGLRLDTKEGAFTKLKSGGVAIVPGKPDESDLIDRIENDDPELLMPPKKSGKQLTAAQIAVLRRWVEQGRRQRRTGPSRRPGSPRCPPSRKRTGRSPRSTASSWPDSRPRGFRPRPRPRRRP